MAEKTSTDNSRVTIILHSGAYDRASYAFSIAQAALASGMEVHMLLTFEGLRRFTKQHLSEIGEETPATVRPDIERAMEWGITMPLAEQLSQARKSGLKLYACPNAMAVLNIGLQDLVEVDDVMGLVAFLALANSAKTNYYI